MTTPPLRSAATDFDFIVGEWTVKHRRLNARLCGCTEWTEFTGLNSTKKILGGFGNVEDNLLRFPQGDVRAAAFRSFDAQSRQWAIWWLDGRTPHVIDVPMVGGFRRGVGTFYADEAVDGRPIRVRFLWSDITTTSCRWQQAFSPDGGKTWETNWIMKFMREE